MVESSCACGARCVHTPEGRRWRRAESVSSMSRAARLLAAACCAACGRAAQLTDRNLSAASDRRELVNVLDHVLDTSMHDSYSIEPDEYAWSKLPGRCCYDVTRPPCNVCKYWGTPDDFCHQSRGHCWENCSPRTPEGARDQFGKLLPPEPPLTYCEGAPPPLVDGNKVCVGASRHSAPCYDELNTGKCTAFGMLTCQAHCWWSPGCALFVVYSVLDSGNNMDGSCVLCYDLHNAEETPNLRTRIFRYTQPAQTLPPAPPSQPSPSPPPHPPPPPPPPQQSVVVPTGGDGAAACTFYAPYELVYEEEQEAAVPSTPARVAQPGDSLIPSPPPPPPKNAMANARVDRAMNSTGCCQMCAEDLSCAGFVFEVASKVCVILPAQSSEHLTLKYNIGMTSGYVRRFQRSEYSPPPSPPPARCSMVSDQGFSGGRSAMIGPGQAPNGQPMASAELCCGSCAAHPQCVKFTFRFQPWSPGIGECILYRDIAEAFIRTGEYLTAGTVLARDIAQVFIEPPFPPQANDAPRPSPPPVPPVFPIMAKLRHEDTSTPQGQDADALDTGAMVSLGGAGLVILLVMRWAFCGSDSGRQAKFARVDKHGKRPGRARG